jgi:hypothetical protein
MARMRKFRRNVATYVALWLGFTALNTLFWLVIMVGCVGAFCYYTATPPDTMKPQHWMWLTETSVVIGLLCGTIAATVHILADGAERKRQDICWRVDRALKFARIR